jgi:NADH pyrophosphatase NudC (nudix superfamily)
MVRIINKDSLLHNIINDIDLESKARREVVKHINNEQEIQSEKVPLVHASWYVWSRKYKGINEYIRSCSNCGSEFNIEDHKIMINWFWNMKYCPYCGARMDDKIKYVIEKKL